MPADETPGDRPEGRPPETELPVDPRIEARRKDVHSRRRLRVWITIGVVAVLLAVAFGISRSSLLDVDEVEVIGAQRTGANQVLEVAGVELGTPLLGLDLSGSRNSIAALPWVDQVRSSRTWGGKVTFDVTERTAVAQVPFDAQIPGEQSWAVVDLQGRVLQVDPIRRQLPVVLFGPVPEPGGWLGGSALPLLEISQALIPLQGEEIGAISWVNGQMIVDLPGVGQVHWGGRDNPRGKAVALATFLARVDLHCYEKVDLSDPDRPALTPIEECS
ncbi:MAG: FtsQ-type POTRA domain-containing protein [Acidimicrobiia bacterium]|nr:FtsQ-type POTRA domain-containing protein [Acidimicrobiia bacterium]MYE72510.1 FtsQ-type POTRA domain-containing protein [Acidimicrobiia bacterium]MYJ62660.1 FtsQ-type POTRA domain-containing protein [Acidimicrobiia bacterium]